MKEKGRFAIMREKRGARASVMAGIACALVLVGVGVALWQPWSNASQGPAADDAALPAGDVEAEGAGGETTGSDDDAGGEEVAYTDGGSGTREERAEFANLDPQVGTFNGGPVQYSYDASIHANKAFVFVGTVMDSEEIGVARNRFEMPMGLTVAVDRVYSGEAFAEGDTLTMFFPISRFVGDDGLVTQCGPRMEAGRSYVFFCDLPEDALVKSWLDDRYPGSPGLADGFDLVVSWDAYCFPVKDGLVCAWMGNGWDTDNGQSISLTREEEELFFEGLFYDEAGGLPLSDPIGSYYAADDFGSVIEKAKSMSSTEAVRIVSRVIGIHNLDYGTVPHLNGETLAYAIAGASGWPDQNALNETVVQVARDFVKAKHPNLAAAQAQLSDSTIPQMNETWPWVCLQDRR